MDNTETHDNLLHAKLLPTFAAKNFLSINNPASPSDTFFNVFRTPTPFLKIFYPNRVEQHLPKTSTTVSTISSLERCVSLRPPCFRIKFLRNRRATIHCFYKHHDKRAPSFLQVSRHCKLLFSSFLAIDTCTLLTNPHLIRPYDSVSGASFRRPSLVCQNVCSHQIE